MEFVIRVAAPPRFVPIARRRVLALVDRYGPVCAWCGLETDLEWPVKHPAAPVAAPDGSADLRLAHRFCVDPVNRKFDRDAPGTLVRRARLAFAVDVARSASGAADQARRWRWFESGSDRERATVAHLRGLLRLGAPVRPADVARVVAGPLLHRLYLARMRRWSRRPLS
ncbi:MAG: hypothetical protein HOV94_13310 [Saccharothrix sp.]|nr:hypothetical protein [Saccharothrix sp.]